jgi:hypothetical protein
LKILTRVSERISCVTAEYLSEREVFETIVVDKMKHTSLQIIYIFSAILAAF